MASNNEQGRSSIGAAMVVHLVFDNDSEGGDDDEIPEHFKLHQSDRPEVRKCKRDMYYFLNLAGVADRWNHRMERLSGSYNEIEDMEEIMFEPKKRKFTGLEQPIIGVRSSVQQRREDHDNDSITTNPTVIEPDEWTCPPMPEEQAHLLEALDAARKSFDDLCLSEEECKCRRKFLTHVFYSKSARIHLEMAGCV